MSGLVGAAAAAAWRRIWPYLVGAAVIAGLAIFIVWLWMSRSAAIAAAEVSAADLKREQLAGQLVKGSGKLAVGLYSRAVDREQKMSRRLADGLKEIRDAKAKSIPVVCLPVLRPLDVALDRMHADEGSAGSDRSATSRGAAAPRASRPRRPR